MGHVVRKVGRGRLKDINETPDCSGGYQMRLKHGLGIFCASGRVWCCRDPNVEVPFSWRHYWSVPGADASALCRDKAKSAIGAGLFLDRCGPASK